MSLHLSEANCGPMDTLHILHSNTTGEPHEMVQNLLNTSSRNYQRTLDILWFDLQKCYGSNSAISKRLLANLDAFPKVTRGNYVAKLRKLQNICRSLLCGMDSCKDLRHLNSREGLKKVWSKMPEAFISRWRKNFVRIERETGDVPSLECLFDYISDFIDEHADPTFEDGDFEAPSKSHRVLSTDANLLEDRPKAAEIPRRTGTRTEPTCHFHKNDGHDTSKCKKFGLLSYDDRRQFVFDNHLCFRCLGLHFVSSCTAEPKCSICSGRHCDYMHRGRNRDPPKASPHFSSARNNCTTVCGVGGPEGRFCSKTLPVQVRLSGSSNILHCYCIVDEQSNVSFCDPSLPQRLELESTSSSYTLATMAGLKTQMNGAAVRGLEVKGLAESRWIPLPDLLTNPYIPDTTAEVATRSVVQAHPHIRHLSGKFPEKRHDYEVLLLLGVNSGEALGTRSFGVTYPYAHHTALGWCLLGPVCRDLSIAPHSSPRALRTKAELCHDHYHASPCFSKTQTTDMIPRNYDPFLELPDEDLPGVSRNSQRFLDIISSRINKNVTGNLEMPLTLKDGVFFQDNRGPVYHRTRNTLMRIAKNPVIANKCQETMQKYLDAGHVEPVQADDQGTPGLVYYLNIFQVYQPIKDKVRLVFDSSASYQGSSLNDALLQGPDVTNRLIGVLLRFRLRRVGFAADVECMFHAFHVSPEHRDVLRFFWWTDNKISDQISVHRARVHIFGNKSSPAIATYGLRHTTTNPETLHLVEAKNFIYDNFYVDDGLGCTHTPEEAIKVLSDARTILSSYNIRLHKIVATDPAVLSAFPPSELASTTDSIDLLKSNPQTALGLQWKMESDSLHLCHQKRKKDFTKRGILSVNSSIFDPLGFVSPVALGGRLLQRKFVSPRSPVNEIVTYDWDDPLPESHLPEWERWVDQLDHLHLLVVPRCFAQPEESRIKSYELHVFADASSEAIGHVIYLRIMDVSDMPYVSFVFANSKVAPRSATSIPRLELCAAVEAAQSTSYVLNELRLPISSVTLYSDSRIVLGYINNTERTFSRYVTTRVGILLKNTVPDQWKYVTSANNPADLASRPHTALELNRTIWFCGPEFLKFSDLYSSQQPEPLSILPETLASSKSLSTKEQGVNDTVKLVLSKCSTWARVVRIVRWIMTFYYNCRKTTKGMPTVDQESALLVVRAVQKGIFPDYQLLSSGKTLPTSSNLISLAPFLDDYGIVRVGGRLSNSAYPFEEKHPILLPSKHDLTTLIIRHYHEKTWHQGRHLTLGSLRQGGFHVLKQGKTISDFIRGCVICRKLRHSPRIQMMADLPADRLAQTPPFQHSGVDVFGHYTVHDGKCTRRSSSGKKVWVLLLTCLYSRAVHLEVINSLDITSLKLALRRFVAVRGDCLLYRSDCGTNFIGAQNLKDSDEALNKVLTADSPGHIWKFLPPHASHFAGVWERKVGSIKVVLNMALGRLGSALLSREEFTTLLWEAASIVNHTPLGDVSADPNDPIPVSPMSLLTLREGVQNDAQIFSDKDLLEYGRHRWRRVQFLADQFWICWKRDYLKSLQIRKKWRKPNRNVAVGDVVVIKDKSQRNLWPMGLVLDVKTSKDGLVRSATIKTKASTSTNPSYLKRAIHDLVVLTSREENN